MLSLFGCFIFATDALSGGVLLHSEEGIFRKCNQCNMTLKAVLLFLKMEDIVPVGKINDQKRIN